MIAPSLVLLALIFVCTLHGFLSISGLAFPPDVDALRDIGFAQGLLDGDWIGDPAYAGVTRYYPPLVPAVLALFARITASSDLPGLWLSAGPILGLLPVLACFIFVRSVFGAAAAACTTALFVFINSQFTDPWIGGGYSPWLLVPLVTQAAFLLSLTVIHRCLPSMTVRGAIGIGLCVGLTFISHAVPGIILTAVLTAMALSVHGLRRATLFWLAGVAAVQAGVMAFYLGPLLVSHPGGVVNTVPENWTALVFERDVRSVAGLVALNSPLLVGALAIWRLRLWPRDPRLVLFPAWVGLCAFELARHEICSRLHISATACRIASVPMHHYHLYLQIAGTCIAGVAACAILAKLSARGRAVLTLAALLAGSAGMLSRPYDRQIRADTLRDGGSATFDLDLYRHIVVHTGPDDLFITSRGGGLDSQYDPAGFAVMAAGRKLVATHVLFSNPYVDWERREALRQALADWVFHGGIQPKCGLPAGRTWAIGDVAAQAGPTFGPPILRTAAHQLFLVRDPPEVCAERL